MRVKSSFSAWIGGLALLAIALVGARQTLLALQSPGHAIRRELTAAGAEMGQLSWSTPTESGRPSIELRQSIEHRFARYHVRVDPAGFPAYVTVTLHGLSREACFDAERVA